MRPRSMARRLAGLLLLLLVTLILLVLVFAAPVRAHALIDPVAAHTGSTATFTIVVPNEEPDSATTAVEIALPEGQSFETVAVQPPTGWSMRQAEDAYHFSGGSVTGSDVASFSLTLGPMPGGETRLSFPVTQTYASGKTVHWDQPPPDADAEGVIVEAMAPYIVVVPEGEPLPDRVPGGVIQLENTPDGPRILDPSQAGQGHAAPPAGTGGQAQPPGGQAQVPATAPAPAAGQAASEDAAPAGTARIGWLLPATGVLVLVIAVVILAGGRPRGGRRPARR